MLLGWITELSEGWCLSLGSQIQIGGQQSGSAAIGKPSSAAARILRLAVSAFAAAGGEAAGVDLLAGLLAAGGHAAYFNACLALVLAARTAPARDAGLAFLTRQKFDMLPIDVVVEAIVQVRHPSTVDPRNSHKCRRAPDMGFGISKESGLLYHR